MERDFVVFDDAKVESQLIGDMRFVRLSLFISKSPDSQSEALPTVVMPVHEAQRLCLRILQCAGLIPNDSENLVGLVQ